MFRPDSCKVAVLGVGAIQGARLTESGVRRCIVLNYSKVKEVEKELATLQFQLKLTSGPKRSALEMFRKKIEAQNACVVAARDRHRAAKKVLEQP